MSGFLFNKIAGLQPETYEKRLQHRCLHVHLMKFLKAACLQNTSRQGALGVSNKMTPTISVALKTEQLKYVKYNCRIYFFLKVLTEFLVSSNSGEHM